MSNKEQAVFSLIAAFTRALNNIKDTESEVVFISIPKGSVFVHGETWKEIADRAIKNMQYDLNQTKHDLNRAEGKSDKGPTSIGGFNV